MTFAKYFWRNVFNFGMFSMKFVYFRSKGFFIFKIFFYCELHRKSHN